MNRGVLFGFLLPSGTAFTGGLDPLIVPPAGGTEAWRLGFSIVR